MKVITNRRGCISDAFEGLSLEEIEGFDPSRAQPADPKLYFSRLDIVHRNDNLKCCNDEEAQIAALILDGSNWRDRRMSCQYGKHFDAEGGNRRQGFCQPTDWCGEVILGHSGI